MDDVAIFFAQGAIADESRQAQIDEFGKRGEFGDVGLGEALAIESADDGGKVGCEGGGEEGIFLASF